MNIKSRITTKNDLHIHHSPWEDVNIIPSCIFFNSLQLSKWRWDETSLVLVRETHAKYCGATNFHQVLKIASFASPLAVAIFCISRSFITSYHFRESRGFANLRENKVLANVQCYTVSCFSLHGLDEVLTLDNVEMEYIIKSRWTDQWTKAHAIILILNLAGPISLALSYTLHFTALGT